MIMDDDDYYNKPQAIKEIWETRKNHDLIVWKTSAAGGVVPYKEYFDKQQFVRANIAMPSFMVKRSIVKKEAFTKGSGGDFNFISKVQPNSEHQWWINQILASTTEGHKQGKGQRKDI